ncbi:MAG TPA: winged helix-turn-helix domain-containing protein [Bacteroidia bacterium]|nr:winged helix-turn-helix domain-containing protein [Bacteroidia bacterium]
MVSSAKLLDDAYRTEHNVDVRERLLLVRRVLVDNEQISRLAENELHRSRWWAYKWVKRYAESGLEGLKNLPRTGRPPQVSGQKFAEIKRELSENLAGWRAKQVMNIIYEKTGIRYHEVHIYRLLHKWGFSPKVPRKRFINTASNKEKKQFKKRPRK